MSDPAYITHRVVPEDGFSSGSDEDRNAVEVTFDSTNPYRRKSSLVPTEPPAFHYQRRTTMPSDCMVHKLLECQRPGPGANPTGQFRAHPVYADMANHEAAPYVMENMEAVVEPKTGTHCKAVLDGEAMENGVIGQEDQQAWTKEMTKSMSDLDLTSKNDEIRSRMLTKKQLSDMAWGVRELSRRLSSMRIRFRVKTIFVLTKIHDPDLLIKTRELVRWLLDKDRDVKYTVFVQDTLRGNKKFDAAGLLGEVSSGFAEDGKMEEDAARAFNTKRLRYWNEDMCRERPHTFDFVITLGGDGTVLYSSWLFQRIVPPVLSFALGSLGFLTKFDFEEYASVIETAFNKGVTVSLRLRFECTVMRSQPRKGVSNGQPHADGETDDEQPRRDLVEELIGEEKDDARTHHPDGTYEILNEIVVDRGPNPSKFIMPPFPTLFPARSITDAHPAMSYTEMFGDDEHFTSILADGICVSTPTGSTAYNLAAGGSLCHPENPVMLVTSICAHTLSFRPIILPDTIVLRVGVPYDARTASWASFDGRERVELRPGDYVTISASRFPFASVQMEGRRSEDWVNSISGKLGWNTRQKQKAFR
ncbi:hypothetical protein S40285_04249 [Stachybotrys chlorohalonatus IBT 40285]|uniref:NAD(+) kinase n=1 Tax=Stachybotrys chlorohalonatus (strain IBT 40285) TaxID=1283841 RepID=A0A084QUD3_STAC4|nr:hypothetical protein S40285_04249 [Stachybotrys chlorohalonata IBT 40285]